MPVAISRPQTGWLWASARPGVRVAPPRSTTSVPGPRQSRTSDASPTAAIRPSRTATAVAYGRARVEGADVGAGEDEVGGGHGEVSSGGEVGGGGQRAGTRRPGPLSLGTGDGGSTAGFGRWFGGEALVDLGAGPAQPRARTRPTTRTAGTRAARTVLTVVEAPVKRSRLVTTRTMAPVRSSRRDDGGDHRTQDALGVGDPPEVEGHGERGEQLQRASGRSCPGCSPRAAAAWYGSAPAAAKARTTTAPRTVCAMPATYGERWRGWTRPRAFGQDALLGEGEAVAVDGVVEGEQGGEDAGDDEDVHQVGGPGADVGRDGGEEQAAGVSAAAATTWSSPKAWITVQTMKA